VVRQRMKAIRRIGRRRDGHRARLDRAARRAQVMRTATRRPVDHFAGGVDARSQLTRSRRIAEGELRRVHANAVGFMHRAGRFVVMEEVALQFLTRDDARAIAEGLVEQAALGLQRPHAVRLVRNIKVATILRFAVNAADQVAKHVERLADLGMHSLRDIETPALDPLRALEAAGRNLRLAPIARAASPRDTIGLQHSCTDAVILRQVDRAGEAGIARADHRNIDIHVRLDRAVVCRWRACGGNPVGRRIVASAADADIGDRIMMRVIGKYSHWLSSRRAARWAGGPCGRRASPRPCRHGG
jgi:hypothetical protein